MIKERRIELIVAEKREIVYGELSKYVTERNIVLLENDLEDCIQEALLLLCANWGELKDHVNNGGWLYLTALHQLMNRSKHNRVVRQKGWGSIDAENGLEEKMVVERETRSLEACREEERKQEILDTIKRCIGSEAYDFLIDYYDQSTSMEDLKKKYSASEPAIRMRCQRLLIRIRKQLNRN